MNELLIAFFIGLSSSGHCLMMCGGIASSLSSNVKQHAFWPRMSRTLLFHLGRISCYASLGFVIGDLLRLAVSTSPAAVFYSRLFAGLMLVIIGAYVMGFGRVARFIESRMAFIWQKLQPVVRQFMGAESYGDAYVIGYLWGFLPCGIIYSTLLWASSQVGDTSAALLMLFFGLGTIPALFASSLFVQKLLTGRGKKIMGAALIVFGLWTMSFVFMSHGNGHDGHSPAMHDSHSQPMAVDSAEQSMQSHSEHQPLSVDNDANSHAH